MTDAPRVRFIVYSVATFMAVAFVVAAVFSEDYAKATFFLVLALRLVPAASPTEQEPQP